MGNTENKHFKQNNYKYIYFSILSIPLFAVDLYYQIADAYKAQDYMRSFVYIAFVLIGCSVGYVKSRKHTPAEALKKGVFRGVGKLDSEEAWPRRAGKDEVCKQIQESAGKPIILVGSSGAGKTTLLETQVKPSLDSAIWKIIHISNYDLLQEQLFDELVTILPNLYHMQFLDNPAIDGQEFNNTQLLLIFDQFEQFLSGNSEDEKESEITREWLKVFLENASKYDNIRILIVVRKEWYYDLRFLDKFVPAPFESIHFTGLNMEHEMDALRRLRQKIKDVTKNDSVTEAVMAGLIRKEEILPVEAQIVGLMLENEHLKIGEINEDYYLNKLNGNDGLIENYFRAYLDSSPNKELAIQVLFALSVETMLRSQLSQQEIADIIHQSSEDIYECLSFFKEHGLILETKNGEYELAHDYLAEKYHDLSGTELDPAARDNILFFWNEKRKSRKKLNIMTSKVRAGKDLVFGDYFLIFSAILLLLRLAGPSYDFDWGWFNPMVPYQMKGSFIDIYYLPIFISHLAWTVYVALFYRNLFVHLNESPLWSFFSKFTIITCAACVVTGVLFPHYWIASIGLGGVVIGSKLYQLSRTPGLGRISIEVFRSIGVKTVINTSIVVLIGLAVGINISNAKLTETLIEQINVAFYIFGMIMTYYMLAVTPDHVTIKATSKMLGLIDRGRVRMQRLNNEIPR